MREGTMKILSMAGFRTQVELIKLGKCPMCEKSIAESEFDEVGKKEYDINGLCQLCQDETFV